MGTIKWYKRDIDAALAGMAMLTLEQRGAYNTVLDLIYESEDRLVDDDRAISARLGCDQRVWKRIKTDLLRLGKIHTSGELLRNFRATSEISSITSFIDQQSRKGVLSGKSRRNKSSNPNDNSGLNGTPVRTPVEPRLEPINHLLSKNLESSSDRPSNGHTDARGLSLDDVSQSLRAIPGIDKHPVALNLDISPIWRLVQAGWDFHGLIVPSIQGILQRTKQNRIRKWSFFATSIEDDGAPAVPPSPPQAEQITDERWQSRMDYARKKKCWDYALCGPLPHTPGCRVPAHLLEPADGKGWIDFKDRPR